jgi:uncharacterized protein YggT (Ycf19 family)
MAFVYHLLNALKVLVIADAVFSWVMGPETFPRSLTGPLLDPIYTPVRDALPPLPVDLTPLLALALIYGVEALLQRSGHRKPT